MSSISNEKAQKQFYTQMRPNKFLKYNKDVRLRISTNAAGQYKGNLTLIVTYKGIRGKRSYGYISHLFPIAPDPAEWDNAGRQFIGKSKQSRTYSVFAQKLLKDFNNIVGEFEDARTAASIIRHYQELNGTHKKHGEEEIEEPTPSMTFGEWLRYIYHQERFKPNNNSTNYQLYLSLLHKLEGRNYRNHSVFDPPTYNGTRLYDVPLSDIHKEHYEALIDWCYTTRNGEGYKNTCNLFKTIYRHAVQRFGMTNNIIDISCDRQQRRSGLINLNTRTKGYIIDNNIIDCLEKATFEKIVKKPSRGISYELTRDFVLCQYYTYQRPADTLLLRYGTTAPRGVIQSHTCIESQHRFYFVPFKLRNRRKLKDFFIGDISNPKSIAIMEKYKGQSAGGYVFPFPMLEKDWSDITDMNEATFAQFKNKMSNTLDAIRCNLNTICEHLGLPKCSLYDFRHSSITHALQIGGQQIAMDIANVSGTSEKMIWEYYFSRDSIGRVPHL